MENERRTMIRELRRDSSANLLAKFHAMTIPAAKSAEDSLMMRQKARFLFKRDKHDANMHAKICDYATRSVVRAPANSESLALAYAERSRVLLHTKNYQDCMDDCKRGLAIADCPMYARLPLHNRRLESALVLGVTLEQQEMDAAKACCAIIRRDADCSGNVDEPEAAMYLRDTELRFGVHPRSCLELEEQRAYLVPTRAAIEVGYNHRWGRHLVATRDIHCGEVVLIEPYHAVGQSRSVECNTCCRHCLKSVWAVVPCDTCDDHVFCSENCKIKAWSEYHDVECGLMNALHEYKIYVDENVVLSLKIVLKAIREAGSIENLKKLVAEIDACDDKSTRGMTNGEFCSNFRALYSLTGVCPYDRHDYLVFANVLMIVALAKYTKLFGPEFSFDSCADLAREPDVVFIGALLLKITTMCTTNSKSFREPNSELTRVKNDTIVYSRMDDFIRGQVIAPYASLINHSCNPNVHRLNTEDGKLMYFSILPIPKGQQIFECYYHPFYSTKPKTERCNYLEAYYKFKCHCDACTLEWGSTPPHTDKRVEHFELQTKLFRAVEIAGPLVQELLELLATLRIRNFLQMSRIRCSAARAIEALAVYPFPNPVTLAFICVLRFAFEGTHGSIKLSILDTCSEEKLEMPPPPTSSE